MAVASTSEEAEIIFNRANVALARSQRLVASWLPSKTEDETVNTKSEEDQQREDDQIFTAVPERLGLGAPIPNKEADGSIKRTELSSNEKLKKQLLGKNYKKVNAGSLDTNNRHSEGQGQTQQRESSKPANNDGDVEEDDEGGRSSLGRRKKTGGGNTNQSDKLNTNAGSSSKKKRAMSYLDEVLSQRKQKKDRKGN